MIRMPPDRSNRIARLLISLYPRKRALETVLVLGEGGRIEDDRVVLDPFLMPFPQVIKNIGLDALNIIKVISCSIRP